jgi:hypothetical protein
MRKPRASASVTASGERMPRETKSTPPDRTARYRSEKRAVSLGLKRVTLGGRVAVRPSANTVHVQRKGLGGNALDAQLSGPQACCNVCPIPAMRTSRMLRRAASLSIAHKQSRRSRRRNLRCLARPRRPSRPRRTRRRRRRSRLTWRARTPRRSPTCSTRCGRRYGMAIYAPSNALTPTAAGQRLAEDDVEQLAVRTARWFVLQLVPVAVLAPHDDHGAAGARLAQMLMSARRTRAPSTASSPRQTRSRCQRSRP